MATVVLISCVKQKLDHPAMAKDLYISSLFKLSWKYAQIRKPDKIFILSAKYHLLEPETTIEPYNQTLNNMTNTERREWSVVVLKELRYKTDIKHDEFILLAGKAYLEYIIDDIVHKEEPLKHLPIGMRISKLKKVVSRYMKQNKTYLNA